MSTHHQRRPTSGAARPARPGTGTARAGTGTGTARPGTARAASLQEDPRRFARRVKRWSVGAAVAAFGVAWALVSLDVVGATNAAAAQPTSSPSTTPHRATVPSADFFGSTGTQPVPVVGSGAGSAPVVRGGTS
ncbi:MAG: hypothetical protein M0T75_05280 [Chloroflexi bacterium]|nr:hypothetical protein [Chloroflexota bacterium]